ncbi:DUF4911 domain-containing protein [bacterium]|nr:DUF4911 domain-containing protein [bacterium]
MNIKLFYKIDPKEINIIQYVFQSYDNLAVFSTVDNKEGIVSILSDIKNTNFIDGVVQSLISNNIFMVPVKK